MKQRVTGFDVARALAISLLTVFIQLFLGRHFCCLECGWEGKIYPKQRLGRASSWVRYSR